jgi:hypothetical protein
MVKMTRQSSQNEIAPTSFPETTPRFSQPTHDFTLQAIIEMQRSLGELSAKTDRLIIDVKSQGDKIDNMRLRWSWLTGGAAFVGFLIAALFAALRYLPIIK